MKMYNLKKVSNILGLANCRYKLSNCKSKSFDWGKWQSLPIKCISSFTRVI